MKTITDLPAEILERICCYLIPDWLELQSQAAFRVNMKNLVAFRDTCSAVHDLISSFPLNFPLHIDFPGTKEISQLLRLFGNILFKYLCCYLN